MKVVKLSPSWALAQVNAKQVMLTNRRTGESYGPGDIVHCYSHHEPTLARLAAERLAKTCTLNDKEREMVARFIS